jgi:hypothetical protein
VKVNLRNALGQLVDVIYDGQIDAGEKNVFLFAEKYAKGVYMIEISSENGSAVQKLIIK